MAAADGAGVPRSPALRPVALRGIPTEAYVALHVHIDDLVREFEIIDLGHHSGAARVPREVHEMIRRILDGYRESRESAWAQAAAAKRSALERFDIELSVPVEAAEAAEELARLFEEAEALARSGVLLTVPLDGELSALRQWMTAELVRQVRSGAAPSPCPLG